MKKIISLATILTVAAMVAGPGVNAATTAELQAQINTLMATLAGLQAQLTAQGGSTGAAPAACAGVTFSANLTVGSTGTAVKCLQAILNASAATQIATTGAGSPGSETTYFGNLTKVAVVKYQTANVIAPAAGYVGPMTRAKLNAALAGGVIPGVTPPAGCTSATEGSYTATLSSTPVSRTVNGGAGLEAYGIDIKAVGSDVTVGSLDLQVSVTNATTLVASNPSTFISSIKVYKDSTSNLVATYTNPSFTLDTAAVYYTSLTGLNLKVAKDATSKLLVVVDTGGTSDNNRTVVFNVYGTGIRGRDCAGIDRFTALATTRTLTIRPASGNATMTVTLASDNPHSQNIQSNATNGVTADTSILRFNAKATGGDTTLVRITVTYTTGASEAIPSVLYLKDGDTAVSSCTPNNTSCVFENFLLPLTSEVSKALKVDANWSAMTDTSMKSFRGISIPAAVHAADYMRSDGSLITTAPTAALAGLTQFIYESGVKVTLVSASATGGIVASTQNGVATGTFKFNVTPFGNTLTQISDATPSTETVNAMFVEAYYSSGSALATSGTHLVLSRVLTETPVGNISDGTTATIDLTMTATVSSATSYGAGTLRFKVDGIQWTVGNNNVYQGEGFAAENLSADFTDTWFTPWVSVQ